MKSAWNNFINSTTQSEKDKIIARAYSAMLEWIISTEYRGGCHDTSAALHMLLCESGIANKLCIGEVKTDDKYFDHSWVEIDNLIYDAAICMPMYGGKYHDPVFKSHDLETGKKTELGYGLHSPSGFDETTRWLANTTLEQYTAGDPGGKNKLWKLTQLIGKKLKMDLDPKALRVKYKNTKREIRSESL